MAGSSKLVVRKAADNKASKWIAYPMGWECRPVVVLRLFPETRWNDRDRLRVAWTRV